MKYLVRFLSAATLYHAKPGWIFFFHCFLMVVLLFNAVKYEVRLENGTVVSKSDGVEFTVGEGLSPLSQVCTLLR
jgi:hypothetical protein